MSEPDGGGLDTLFSFGDEPAAPQQPQVVEKRRSRALFLLRNVALVAAATTVTVAALRAADRSTSILLIAAAFTGLRAIMYAVSQVAAPRLPKRRPGTATGPGAGPGGDELRAAVRRWERTLATASVEMDLYPRNVAPVLTELTDERLRLRHGFTCATDPRRAKELLGEQAWAILHNPGRFARARELEILVTAMERL